MFGLGTSFAGDPGVRFGGRTGVLLHICLRKTVFESHEKLQFEVKVTIDNLQVVNIRKLSFLPILQLKITVL